MAIKTPTTSRTVSQKMGVKEGMRAFFLNAPESALNAINLPSLDVGSGLQGEFDYLHFFTKTQAEMDDSFPKLKRHLKPTGMLWLSWPKGKKLGTDLALPAVIRIGYSHGLVESTCLSVDATWSGLKFTQKGQNLSQQSRTVKALVLSVAAFITKEKSMSKVQTLRGMATVSFYAGDVKAARNWYAELLDIKPYFERPNSDKPEYVEFRLGDYEHELGIIDAKYAPKGATAGPGGAVVFWHVDDIAEMLKKVIAMGAKEYEPLINREAGFITASVVDPFGNILGLMRNPHYLEILASKEA